MSLAKVRELVISAVMMFGAFMVWATTSANNHSFGIAFGQCRLGGTRTHRQHGLVGLRPRSPGPVSVQCLEALIAPV
jgi:hypothetical protein